MVKMFFDKHIKQSTKTGKEISVDDQIDEKYLEHMATRMEGFSGRQVAKTVLGMQAAVFGYWSSNRRY